MNENIKAVKEISNKKRFFPNVKNKTKGITLVALVITIIIIIILSTITINMAFGDNGLISQIKGTRNETTNMLLSDEIKMNGLISGYANMMNGNSDIAEPVIPIITGNITFGEIEWSNSQASITVNTNTSFYIEYQVNKTTEGEWISIDNNSTIDGLKHGDIVYARLTDGIDVGDYVQTSIEDNTLPQNATITLSSNTSFMNNSSTTATVTQVDNESGVDITKCKWIYTTQATEIGTNESSYTNSFTQNGQTITITGTQAGNFYLHVLTVDFAGNKRESISSAVQVKDAKAASNLKVGDYIYYDPGTRSYTSPSSVNGMSNQTFNSGSYKGTWRVLTNNGTSVTIIPSFSVDYFQVKGQAGYNNFISELNKICEIYIHPTYATSARIVQYSDVNTLTSIGTLNIGRTYWLGDKYSEVDGSGRTFYYGRTVVSGGAIQSSWIYYVSGSGNIYTDTPAFDVRPIVTLKPDALLERGTGASDDYYYLR